MLIRRPGGTSDGHEKGAALAHCPGWSVLGCKHDGEQADGLPRIARVSGSVFETGVEKLKMAARIVGGGFSPTLHDRNLDDGTGQSDTAPVNAPLEWITRSEIGRPNPRIPSWGGSDARPRTEARSRNTAGG